MKLLTRVTGLALLLPIGIHAQSSFQFTGLNLLVPDDDSSGVANQQTINLGSPSIDHVSVTLNLSGVGGDGFNGDLYAYLQHGSGFSVLLNRPGRDAGKPGGFGDNGFSITLDDFASTDIHNYRAALGGPIPLASAVTGTWQPDARQTDPANVVTADPRTTFLSSFDGVDPNGTWTLFVADLAPGGQVRLESWGLTLATVPDGSMPFGLVVASVLLWAERRRSRFSR